MSATPPEAADAPENYATVLAYLDEAERQWMHARDDSGYQRFATWAGAHGLKLIFGWRRTAQDGSSPSNPNSASPPKT